MKRPVANQSRLLSLLLISAILFIALVLRLPHLNGSFWLDEAAQALESARPLSEQLNIDYDFQPPLLHLIVHFSLYVSRQEWWLRTIAALIPGLVSIWATYEIGKKLLSPTVGGWAALLLATSSFHIFYSQELRPYALPLMLATLSWLVLLNWPPANRKLSWFARYPVISPYMTYALLTLFGLYSSYLYPFLILGQAAYILFLKRDQLLTYSYHALFWILGFLPWLPSFFDQFAVGGEVRAQLPGWDKVVSIDAVRSLALVVGKFMFGVLDLRFSLLFIAAALFIICILKIGVGVALLPKTMSQRVRAWFEKILRLQKNNPLAVPANYTQAITIVLIWLVVPLLSAWLISFVVPVLHPKRVLFLLPSFYLLLTASTLAVPHLRTRKLILAVLLAINLYSTSQYYLQPRLQRENWRELHSIITQLYPHKSIAVFAFPEPFAPWQWYDQTEYPTVATGTLAVADAQLDQTTEVLNDYTYVLVFDYLRDLTDPNDQLLAAVQSQGFQEMDFLDQTNIGFVRIYAQPPVTISSVE